MLGRDSTLEERITNVVNPAFRNRLLDQGIARGLIWTDGNLPPGSPGFPETLSTDLLDYAYGIMSMALRLRIENRSSNIAKNAFRVAGESIQAAVHKGDQRRVDLGFHRTNAALAFHLAGYPTLAYSILPSHSEIRNLSPTEQVLVLLFQRQFEDMRTTLMGWLRNENYSDDRVAAQLINDSDFNEDDAIHTIITTAFMRGMSFFDHALKTGQSEFAEAAKEHLLLAADTAGQLQFVNHWWTITFAWQLVDEIWGLSLHSTLPTLPTNDLDHARWNQLRSYFVKRLMVDRPPTVALWPSQVDAASRSANRSDDLVVALPTSAGKTRIAEFCILRALASDTRIVYVTPLRALSAQIERDLSRTFLPLGFTVSSLYNGVEIDSDDKETLREGHIVVCTPEKLSFALRNDEALLADVGLIVLDEGHMLGRDEREVRYEVLVNALLSRTDANNRRIVTLSALFPSPDEMSDMVSWIRRDVAGDPIHSDWRPTIQRYGTIQWYNNRAELDFAGLGQRSYIRRFVEPIPAPKPPRKKCFPQNKNELTLASAWRFVLQDRRVFIFSPRRDSVETLGRLVLRCIKQGVLTSFATTNERIVNAMNTGSEWLGESHPAVRCLEYGVAVHHAGLPRPFLSEVERLMRNGDCPLVIASPTLAKGINLSASVLLIPTISRGYGTIDAQEFANVTGRAGRAYVDMEGLILHVMWPKDSGERTYQLRKWRRLVRQSGTKTVTSGLLTLLIQMCERIAERNGVSIGDVLDYVTSNENAWTLDPLVGDRNQPDDDDWARDLASLDAAILALIEAATDITLIEANLVQALLGSLFEKSLAKRSLEEQRTVPKLIAERARIIWAGTNEEERRGMYFSGVGYRTGIFLRSHIENLVSLLLAAEKAMNERAIGIFAETVISFAEYVFQHAPFVPEKKLPEMWQSGLDAWLKGRSGYEVVEILGGEGVFALQDAFTYRLPWAMEAVRVHAGAVGAPGADEVTGIAARATGVGCSDLSVIALIRHGFRSRAGAQVAVATTGATFTDRKDMEAWLDTEEVRDRQGDPLWPTPQTRHEWEQFIEYQHNRGNRRWHREVVTMNVNWFSAAPDGGTDVLVEQIPTGQVGIVLSPDFVIWGSHKRRLIVR